MHYGIMYVYGCVEWNLVNKSYFSNTSSFKYKQYWGKLVEILYFNHLPTFVRGTNLYSIKSRLNLTEEFIRNQLSQRQGDEAYNYQKICPQYLPCTCFSCVQRMQCLNRKLFKLFGLWRVLHLCLPNED